MAYNFLNRIYAGNAKGLVSTLLRQEIISSEALKEPENYWQKISSEGTFGKGEGPAFSDAFYNRTRRMRWMKKSLAGREGIAVLYSKMVLERSVMILHRIAVISDTHGLLRPEVMENLRGCEAILHGGDINKQKILDELERIAPLYAVRGNNDRVWAKDLPETLSFTLCGLRFFMVHNKKMVPKDLIDTDIIVYGHSHKYEESCVGGRLWLNPGSCGPRRFNQPVTMAVLEIAQPQELSAGAPPFGVKKIEIAHHVSGAGMAGAPENTDKNEQIPQNIRQIILSVMKETNRGKPVREIAAKNGISEGLAEQICRLYLTHPGVDADGIMGKMGV